MVHLDDILVATIQTALQTSPSGARTVMDSVISVDQ